MKYDGILFDLDGTLIDSAFDLVATLNAQLAHYQRPPVKLEDLRSSVSHGSAQLMRIGFNNDFPKDFQALRQDYLELYESYNRQHTDFFAGIEAVLSAIDASQTPWGIVTNKLTQATQSISAHLGLDQRVAAIVCGDTLPVAKPDPSPILLACDKMGVKADNCVYIGDAATDIEAGKAANMATIACAYGYVSPEAPVDTWGADAIAHSPADLHALLFEA